MANEVDDRVVNMKFDNAAFERNISETLASLSKLHNSLKFTDGLKGLGNLNTSAATDSLNQMGQAVEGVSAKFSALGIAAGAVIFSIASKLSSSLLNFSKQFTVAPIMDGFREMETKMGSIQTILANTARHGTGLEEVTANLEELNKYSDRTIYNFGDMTKNIGLFTNAGIKVGDATQMIKGFSNAAAASGTTAEGAAGAAYQLSQALSAGKVTLMDWRSLTNVGMGNANMKDGILEIAKAMGTLEKTGTSVTDIQNDFNGTLQNGWITTDVMSSYLRIMSGDMGVAEMAAIGLSQATISSFQAQQKTAEEAATKVRTFTQLVGTIKESVGSGWAQTFEILTGGFEGGTQMFTAINDAVGGFVGRMSDARNVLLKAWADLNGRLWIFDAFKIGFGALGDIVKAISKAFRTIFPPATAEQLVHFSWLFQHIVRMFDEAVQRVLPAVTQIFTAIFSTLKVGMAIVKGVIGLFVDFFEALYPDRTAGNVLGFIGTLASGLTKLNMFLLNSGIPGFFKLLSTVLVGTARVIARVVSAIATFIVGLGDLGPIKAVGKIVGEIGDGFEKFFRLIRSGQTVVSALAVSFGSLAGGGIAKLLDVLSAVGDAFKTVGKAAVQAFDILFRGDFKGGPLGEEDGSLVNVLFNIRESFIRLGQVIGSIDFSGILGNIGNLFSSVKNAVAGFFGSFGDDTDKIDKVEKSLERVTYQFQLISKTISAADLGGDDTEKKTSGLKRFFEGIGNIISSFIERITGYVKGIGELGSNLRKAVADFFTGEEIVSSKSGFEALVDIINAVLFTGILLSVRRFITQMGGLVRQAGAVMDNLSDTLTSFGRKQESNSTKLLKIAIALGLLAGSLWVIAKIPRDDLYAALAAMGGGLTVMFASLVAMDKFLKGPGLSKAATAMVVLSVALKFMAGAIKTLAELEPAELVKGTLAAAVGLAALASATKLVQSNGPGMIAAATAVLALSGALVIMAGAIKLFAAFDMRDLAVGLAAASIALVALGFAAGKVGPGMILAGPGILIMSTALLVIARAVRQFGNMDFGVLVKGLLAVHIALGSIASTIGLLPPSFFLVAAGMPLIAGAIIIIAEAIRRMGEIGAIDLAKGLLALVISLNAIAGAVWLMQNAMAGAIAMLVVAGALRILTEVIIQLGSQSFGTIMLGLVAMTGAFLVLAAAGYFLAPALTALGAAMLLVGGGFFLFGVGVAAVVAAFVYLANSANENARKVMGVLGYLADEIPKILRIFIDALARESEGVAKSFGKIMDSIRTMIVDVLDTIIEVIPKVVEVVDKIVDAIIQFIGNRLEDFIDMGFQIIGALMRGLLDNIGSITTTVVEILAEFSRTVSREMPSIVDSGVRILTSFIHGIGSRMDDVVKAGVSAILEFINGVASQAVRLAQGAADALIAFLDGLTQAIRVNAPRIRDSGIELAKAILSGITGGLTDLASIDKVVESAKNVAKKVVDGFKSVIPFASPSPLFIQIGKWIVQGLGIGLTKERMAEVSAVESAERIVEAFAKTLTKMPSSLEGMDVNPVITPVLDLSRVAAGARGLEALMGIGPITPEVSTARANLLATTAEQENTDNDAPDPGPTSITFIQNNNSPKALSTNDIFRRTKSQVALAKEKLGETNRS